MPKTTANANRKKNRRRVPLPRLARENGVAVLRVDDQPFYIIGGEAHNSANGSPEHLAKVLGAIKKLHANTVLVPISWEMVEPTEGKFDFTSLAAALDAARKNELRLGLLWFGAYKNADTTYAPLWVKNDQRRFPRNRTADGKIIRGCSVFSKDLLAADTAAFAKMMKYLAEHDAETRTVILIQVENEVGILGAERDFSPLAEAVFAAPPPPEFLTALNAQKELLAQQFPLAWENWRGRAKAKNWRDAFGAAANEMLIAWGFARYCQQIAAAGKAVYPLPHYVNCWLVQYPDQPPGEYPSGGPVSRVAAVWRAAAPDLDFLAPDIYLPTFAKVCADYVFADNPLFIPEAWRGADLPARALYAIGHHHALGFCPFGIESLTVNADAPKAPDGSDVISANDFFPAAELPQTAQQLRRVYQQLNGLAPRLHELAQRGRVDGAIQSFGAEAGIVNLGGLRLRFRWRGDAATTPGGALVFSPTDGEFYVLGLNFSLDLLPPLGAEDNAELRELWYGEFVNGDWHPLRHLNGDEFFLNAQAAPQAIYFRTGLVK